ncbi:MAG: gliding motility-associated C-terminal domain-containing protein, partial [Cyclobacteriaceae bacterium]
WYIGDGTTTPLTDAAIGGNGTLAGETTAHVSGIPGGEYTVTVQDNTTGCVGTYLGKIEDRPRDADFNVNVSAVTNCVNPDGSMTLQHITTPGIPLTVADFDIYWFIGAPTNPDTTLADFTGISVLNLAADTYTVVLAEKADRFCQSVETFNIPDGTVGPDFTLSIESHATVCFDVKDGFARVDVADFSRVNIEWLDDTNTVISTQFFADSLAAGSYIVSLTDINTGCIATEVFNIDNTAITPSDPLIIVNNNRINCTEPNGSAVANVDGDQTGFLFEWFEESDLSTPYTTGSEVFNLDSATYLVRATNLSTGCQSALSSVTIEYEIQDPIFEVVFSLSACLRTEDGAVNQFDGDASVFIDETTNPQQRDGQLKATNYEWRDSNGDIISEDAKLIDTAPGEYTVSFTARNGCTYSASFSMTTNVTVYNGVSANDDGMNDFFLIDCVDYFSGNSVKIYNRAGSLVYKVDNYDNVTTRFEGLSNIGRNGRQLPEGTYYYLIDKGDGSDVIQGYLELVR